MNDRRRFPRIERSLITYFRRTASADDLPLAALATNISRGGLCISMDEQLSPGDRIELEIVLKDREPPINLNGRVVRTSAEGVAIEFLAISETDRARLDAYLASRLTNRG